MTSYDKNRDQNQGQKRDRDGQFKSGPGREQTHGQSQEARTGNSNPGNFANDREKASEAGRKGGQNSHGGQKKDDANDW